MTNSSTIEELYSIREWAPLTDIFERIPASCVHRTIFPFSTNINITCVDTVADFLALGSDVGIVFWYNRKTGEMQKLKPELSSRITCVKIVDSVEYMVAAGSSSGQVSIFQIQKEIPSDLNIVAPCTRSKPIERYTIRDLHRCMVSYCEWSKNGMKLFSGDRQGIVVLTEFDYQAHVSKSMEILSEAYEIIQLSVHQSYLLVSTLYRCIVCQRNEQTKQWRITQIGKKDRKQLVDCGGIFLKHNNSKKPLLICGRPGLRFWLANVDGEVEKTLLFKDAVQRSPTWEIPILNPKNFATLINRSSSATNESAQNKTVIATNNFRNMYVYAGQDTLLVTHDDATLYILNIESLRVEAVARGFRKIVDFCVCNKEIFVLEGDRSLLRLAPLPEKPNRTAKVIFNPLLPPPVPILGASICGTFESPVEYEPEEQPVIRAEECFELPPIETLNPNVPIELAVESPLAEQNRRQEMFRQIGEMDFEQSILHKSGIAFGKGRKKRKQKPAGVVEIGHETKEATTMSQQQNLNKPVANTATLMDASFCNLENNGATTPQDMRAAYTKHLPDAISPNTLQKTIAEKAKTLAEELDLPEVHLAPITDEELRVSQACAAPPTPLLPSAPLSSIHVPLPVGLQHLSQCYPGIKGKKLEEAGVQTTPQKKIYYVEENAGIGIGDYSSGQPVDDLCSTLGSTNLISTEDVMEPRKSRQDTGTSIGGIDNVSSSSASSMKIVNEESATMLDVSKFPDPLRIKEEPQSSDSTISSDWEFLDN